MSTINVSLPSDGSTADVSDYNTPITTIVNEFNGNIDNSNIKSGAAIATSKLADDAGITAAKLADAAVTPAKWTNPYKFSVYRNSAWTTTNGVGKVQFDTEEFDTNNNYDSTTNYRYTAPVNGFYQFNASVGFNPGDGAGHIAYLYKNGSSIKQGGSSISYAGPFNRSVGVSALIQLSAGDYIEIYFYGNGGAGGTGTVTWFNGFLVSQT